MWATEWDCREDWVMVHYSESEEHQIGMFGMRLFTPLCTLAHLMLITTPPEWTRPSAVSTSGESVQHSRIDMCRMGK